MSNDKCVVKYLRLSLEDDDILDESNSITNQRIVIGQYIASKNEFKNAEVLEFKDDGYSGTNFERPGFQSMMELVRDGRVSTIIVKDLSRFGRNHIEVDTYLEQIFPFLNVRFIAINDNVDSMKYESGMPGIDVGFRNIINEHHSIDTSVKVKRTLIQRQKAGKYMGARSPWRRGRRRSCRSECRSSRCAVRRGTPRWLLRPSARRGCGLRPSATRRAGYAPGS